MAIQRVQGNVRKIEQNSSSPPASVSLTLDSAPIEGNVLIAVCGNHSPGNNANISSISQTNVSWSCIITKNGSDCRIEIWLGVVGSGASKDITVNYTGGSSSTTDIINVCEYSGVATSDFTDKTASATGSNPTTDTGTTEITTQADELWIGGIMDVGTGGDNTQSSPTSGFTLLDGTAAPPLSGWYTSSAYLEKIVSATGQANSGTTDSLSNNGYAGCIATFKASAGAVLKEVTDSLSLSGSVFRNKPSLTVTDTIGASDKALRNKPSLTITDSVGLADTLKRSKTFTIIDVLGLADVILLNKTLAISDNIGANDVALGNKMSLIVSDSISLADLANVITGAIIKTVLDSIGLADVAYTPSRVLQTLDSVGLADNIIVNKVLQITETINLVEIIQVGVGGIKETKLFFIMGDLAVQLTGE